MFTGRVDLSDDSSGVDGIYKVGVSTNTVGESGGNSVDPLPFGSTVLITAKEGLRTSTGAGCELPFCGESANPFECIVSMCCGKVIIAGRGSLGV
jgi:hypothetical protein